MLHGPRGATAVDLYTLGSVEIGPIRREGMIGLPLQHGQDGDAGHAGHAGVLGAGALAKTRTTFDYAGAGLFIQVAENRPALAGAVSVELLYDIFILAPARIGDVSVTAVVDTGARHSIGNAALQAALGFASNDPRLRPVPAAGRVSDPSIETRAGAIAGVTLGDAGTSGFDLAFAALPVFNALGIADRPAMILGADVLHQWRGFTIDYSSRTLAVLR
jgi:hypothetical protein